MGGTPIWLPLTTLLLPAETLQAVNIGFRSLLKQWTTAESSNTPITILLAVLAAESWIFRIGWTLLKLPSVCHEAGWELPEWLKYSRRIPSRWSLFTRGLPIAGAARLYFYDALSVMLTVVGVSLPIIGIFVVGGAIAGGIGCGLGVVMVQLAVWLRAFITREALKGARPDEVKTPTLYLRAFKDDAVLGGQVRLGVTLEEAIILGLMSEGRPVVALGKPGEKLPPVGAQRFYVEDTEWQDVIRRWIASSHAIVLVAASTEGTRWEQEAVFAANAQQRFLILFVHEGTVAQLFGLRRKRHDAEETTLLERLVQLGVLKVDCENTVPTSDTLIGLAFDEQKNAILLASGRRDESSVVEALKWQARRLPREESHEKTISNCSEFSPQSRSE
jgi:hypothetical protein